MSETETITKPEVVAQLVNEMKASILEIKTIRAVTENKQPAKKTNIEITTKRNKQTNKKKQGEPKGPHYWSRLNY